MPYYRIIMKTHIIWKTPSNTKLVGPIVVYICSVYAKKTMALRNQWEYIKEIKKIIYEYVRHSIVYKAYYS